MRLAWVLLLAPTALGCNAWGGSVTRVYSGREVEERYVSPEAYAHYAQATLDEAGGDDAGAALEYARAAEEDPDSADIYTRLGRVHCRLKSGKHAVFFERAEELDPQFAPLHRERALCFLRENDPAKARDAAARAVVLDPDDEASSLALGEAERRLGHADEARRWLLALSLRDPGSSRARAAYENLNRKTDAHDPAPVRVTKQLRENPKPALADVDRALASGDSKLARRLATRAGITPSSFALRAAAFGLASLARKESARVLAADPTDSDAFVAALVAEDLERDELGFAQVASRFAPESLEASSLALRLFAELIAERVGSGAARTFLEKYALPAASDPLEQRVQTRLAE